MKLGIIGWFDEVSFQLAANQNLEFMELCVNDAAEAFLTMLEQTKLYSEQYDLPIASLGRWGADKIDASGCIIESELALEYQLIEAAAYLECPIYVTGCNFIETLSYFENVKAAITYFEKLIEYGKLYNVKIATYNCRWNNFVHSDMAWELIHGYLKDLGIKYDTSHCIYAGGDYLSETKKWGHRFVHVHIKGALVVDNTRYDDPPAGLDQTDWRSFMALLYSVGYDAGLSIEPHSAIWRGELGDRGTAYTIRYMRELII